MNQLQAQEYQAQQYQFQEYQNYNPQQNFSDQLQTQQFLQNLPTYQKVFKITSDGKVVCNFEDVKKYMESEICREITPKLSSGIKRIVEIYHHE